MSLSWSLPNYDRRPPFSSFLPGIAGLQGVPLWVFYVNRGQAVASFGVADKDHAMLEFYPANKAYRLTPLYGFRTFLKVHTPDGVTRYEPFAPWEGAGAGRTMHIGLNYLDLEEHHPSLGLRVAVRYFTLTNLPIAGLVRRVTLHNEGDRPLRVAWLDGLPQVVPFGAGNWALKFIARTIEAWMQVEEPLDGVPFYRLRASIEDRPEVEEIVAGHFALATCFEGEAARPLLALVDPEQVFAWDDTLQQPVAFWAQPLETLLATRREAVGKTPAALFAAEVNLPPGEAVTLAAVFGHSDQQDALPDLVPDLRSPSFLAAQEEAAHRLAEELTAPAFTRSGDPRFDGYVRQSFLDNLLRGGWPLVLPGGHVYHVYSRKHGDLERDYNDFRLAPEYYSQGNGNYRDVAQSRRLDVWFEPGVEDFTLKHFLSLIQADGYNPLVIQGLRFRLDEGAVARLLEHTTAPELLRPHLASPWTPGGLLKALERHRIPLDVPAQDFVMRALAQATAEIQAEFGEGFWVDHWTYLLDLLEAFAAVYPERLHCTLFATEVPFYNSPVVVRPRRARYVLTERGPRQLHALAHDEEKARLLEQFGPWLRAEGGRGPVFTLTVAEKLLLLALLKFTTRDPWGMGVEMEAGKPGWYDALNGLPALFGSSMPETYELLRLLRYLKDRLAQVEVTLRWPEEAEALLEATLAALDLPPDDGLARWDALHAAREAYREQVRLGVSGRTVARPAGAWVAVLERLIADLEAGIARAHAFAWDGVPVTYFAWVFADYEVQTDAAGEPCVDEAGRPFVWPRAVAPRPLPLFLEGPVRAMKVLSPAEARRLHGRVLQSPLWDGALGMFKVNASLAEESHEIGRARAFPPGWLENESIWLHMHYKYLLELLRQGLYAEFFALARQGGLIPFRDPEQYGRSPLENCSFLVSSAHPDARLHGRGFVARLTGATVEFLSMWALMMAGPRPFVPAPDGLRLQLRPALPGWLFSPEGTLTFTFLGRCRVTLHNPARADLFPGVPTRIVLRAVDGTTRTVSGPDVPPPYAEQVRAGQIAHLEVHLVPAQQP